MSIHTSLLNIQLGLKLIELEAESVHEEAFLTDLYYEIFGQIDVVKDLGILDDLSLTVILGRHSTYQGCFLFQSPLNDLLSEHLSLGFIVIKAEKRQHVLDSLLAILLSLTLQSQNGLKVDDQTNLDLCERFRLMQANRYPTLGCVIDFQGISTQFRGVLSHGGALSIGMVLPSLP
jgi:hypothetical protein